MFKIGNEIVITKDVDAALSIIKKGTKGKIISAKTNLGYYGIALENGEIYDLRGCFELLKPNDYKFKTGDEVKIVLKGNFLEDYLNSKVVKSGEKGIVRGFIEKYGLYSVSVDNFMYLFKENQLEKVEQEIKIGDKIRTTKDISIVFGILKKGTEGTIESTAGLGERRYLVKIEGVYVGMTIEEFELIPQSEETASKEQDINDPDIDSYYESVHQLAVEIAKETTYTTAQIQYFIETCDILHEDIEELKKCIKIGTPTIQLYFDFLSEYGDKNLERIKKEQSIPKNPYWENIQKMAQKQRAKGISKYGAGLEDNTELDTIESITYLQEELIDALMYCEHLKAKVNKIKNL